MSVNKLLPVKISDLPYATPVPTTKIPVEQPDGSVKHIEYQSITNQTYVPTDAMLKSTYDTDNDGVVDNAENLNGNPSSYYLNRGNHTGEQAISTVTGLQAALDGKIDDTEKGAANGVCPLNSSGTINPAYLPFAGLSYLGTWDANTNTPTISDAGGSLGEWYKCSVAGTQNLGSGNITFAVGDWVIHNGTVWERNGDSSSVTSVNGQTGAVVLNASHISEVTNKRFISDPWRDALIAAEAAGLNNTNRRFALLNEVQASISVIPGILSPEAFGATHSTDTFADRGYNQAYIDANYPGIGAVTTDTIDWAAIQKCYYLAGSQDAVIMFSPYTYRTNKPIVMPSNPKTIKTIGNNARIKPVNNTPYAVLGQPLPANQAAADIVISFAKTDIDSLILEPNSNQKGLSINCSYNSVIENVYVYGGTVGIEAFFTLRAIFNNCFLYGSVNGLNIKSGVGMWTGATKNNSATNMTKVQDCTFKMLGGQNAITFHDCQGMVIDSPLIEGTTCVRGIEIDSMMSTDKYQFIRNIYMECTGGISDTLIHYRTDGDVIDVDGIICHYACKLVDAASTSGVGQINISNVRYAPLPGGGKYFTNSSMWWTFRSCWQFYNPASPIATYQSFFSGTVPTYHEDIMPGTVRTISPLYNTGTNKFMIVN